MMKITILFLFFLAGIQSFAQSNLLQNLDKKLSLAEKLLNQQPDSMSLKKMKSDDFKIQSFEPFIYHLKDKNGKEINVYLHIKSLQIVYIEFFENETYKKDIYNYLQNNKHFVWDASEHNCDYLNNSSLSLTICPGMKKGMMIHVSKFVKMN